MYVCVDLGASSTRVATSDRLVHEIPNNVRVIPLNEDTHMTVWDAATYEESVLNALDVTVMRHEGANQYLEAEQRYLVGTIADRYGSTVRPNGMEPKHKQVINYQNAILAIAFEWLMTPQTYSNPGVATPIEVFVALPPIECKGSEKIFQDNLKGTYTVQFNSLSTAVTFQIADVKCKEESLLSLMNFFFNSNGSLRQENIKYRNGNSLSIDIGASTTDLAVMVNGKYLEKSGFTIPIGGNQIRDFVMNEIQMAYSFMPQITEADYVVKTGMLRLGAQEVDFSQQLRRAKEEFAIQLKDRLNSYFKQIGMSLASFMCITVGGGGSLHSCVGQGDAMNITTPALSEIIMAELHKQCPTVDVIPAPGNPRHANINGLLVYGLVWEQRAAKQANQRMIANAQATAPIMGQPAQPQGNMQGMAQAPNNYSQTTATAQPNMYVPTGAGQVGPQ